MFKFCGLMLILSTVSSRMLVASQKEEYYLFHRPLEKKSMTLRARNLHAHKKKRAKTTNDRHLHAHGEKGHKMGGKSHSMAGMGRNLSSIIAEGERHPPPVALTETNGRFLHAHGGKSMSMKRGKGRYLYRHTLHDSGVVATVASEKNEKSFDRMLHAHGGKGMARSKVGKGRYLHAITDDRALEAELVLSNTRFFADTMFSATTDRATIVNVHQVDNHMSTNPHASDFMGKSFRKRTSGKVSATMVSKGTYSKRHESEDGKGMSGKSKGVSGKGKAASHMGHSTNAISRSERRLHAHGGSMKKGDKSQKMNGKS